MNNEKKNSDSFFSKNDLENMESLNNFFYPIFKDLFFFSECKNCNFQYNIVCAKYCSMCGIKIQSRPKVFPKRNQTFQTKTQAFHFQPSESYSFSKNESEPFRNQCKSGIFSFEKEKNSSSSKIQTETTTSTLFNSKNQTFQPEILFSSQTQKNSIPTFYNTKIKPETFNFQSFNSTTQTESKKSSFETKNQGFPFQSSQTFSFTTENSSSSSFNPKIPSDSFISKSNIQSPFFSQETKKFSFSQLSSETKEDQAQNIYFQNNISTFNKEESEEIKEKLKNDQNNNKFSHSPTSGIYF